jgi:hypothetical protein
MNCSLNNNYYVLLMDQATKITLSLFVYYSVLIVTLWIMLEQLRSRDISVGIESGCGRAIAEAVSRWFPTTAARVRARVWKMGFVVDKVASGQVFSEYFGFRTKTTHSTNFSSSQSPGGS